MKHTASTPTTSLSDAIIEAIHDRKGRRIALLDLSDIESAPAQQFLVCEGSSTTQVEAIADNIREHVQKATSLKPYNYDGYGAARWIVIDYGHLLVHVFLPEERHRYALEELWSDAALTLIDDID